MRGHRNLPPATRYHKCPNVLGSILFSETINPNSSLHTYSYITNIRRYFRKGDKSKEKSDLNDNIYSANLIHSTFRHKYNFDQLLSFLLLELHLILDTVLG